MINFYRFLIVCIFSVGLTYSQDQQAQKILQEADSILTSASTIDLSYQIDTDVQNLDLTLSSSEYKKALVNQLSAILAGQDALTIGNYAGIDIEDASASLAVSLFLKSGHIINTKFKGGVTDGLSAVFNNNKLNTNLSAEVQYHFINSSDRFEEAVLYNQSQRNLFLREKQKLLKERQLKERVLEKNSAGNIPYISKLYFDLEKLIVEYKNNLKSIDLLENNSEDIEFIETQIQLNELEIDKKELDLSQIQDDKFKEKTLEKEIQELNIANNKLELKKVESKNPLLKISILKKQSNEIIEKIALKIEQIKEFDPQFVNDEMYRLQEEYLKKIEELKKTLKFASTGLKVSWFSLGYKVKNDAFNLYDSTEPFSQQLSKKDAISHELTFQYSWYQYIINNKFRNFYSSLGLQLEYTNNLAELKGVEVVDENIQNNGGTSRKIASTTNAFAGDFYEHIRGISFYWDHYHFLYLNKWALHVRPEHFTIQKRKPITNLAVGMLFSFKDKDKEKKSPVNVEAFYQFGDLFKNTETDLKLFERNKIGLRFVFPINFQPFNK